MARMAQVLGRIGRGMRKLAFRAGALGEPRKGKEKLHIDFSLQKEFERVKKESGGKWELKVGKGINSRTVFPRVFEMPGHTMSETNEKITAQWIGYLFEPNKREARNFYVDRRRQASLP